MDLHDIYRTLRTGAETLSVQTAAQKNAALCAVAEALDAGRKTILAANKIDIENARAAGTKETLVDRLSLDDTRIDGIIASLRTVIAQSDPVGEEISGWRTPGGLTIRTVRVPLGVVAIIYESRPNVTVDAFCLAYKSGNAVLLRGSSSAYNSNKAIVDIIKDALSETSDGVPSSIALVKPDGERHDDVQQILNAVGEIDVVLPRGGSRLIKTVVENARVPVIETGSGVCHLYVDEYANLEMAAKIAENAKIQRPGVCNAIECILVNEKIAGAFLPLLKKQFAGRVELRADDLCYSILEKAENSEHSAGGGVRTVLVHACDDDYGFEFLDYICCIKSVRDVEEAVSYINSHNTGHSESIVTENRTNARMFQTKVDAACVYVNSSTRFTDGGEFGFGAELGISTQKLHARGPMGIKALTTIKYLIDGDGQIR